MDVDEHRLSTDWKRAVWSMSTKQKRSDVDVDKIKKYLFQIFMTSAACSFLPGRHRPSCTFLWSPLTSTSAFFSVDSRLPFSSRPFYHSFCFHFYVSNLKTCYYQYYQFNYLSFVFNSFIIIFFNETVLSWWCLAVLDFVCIKVFNLRE